MIFTQISQTVLTRCTQIKLALDPRCILNPDKVVQMEAGF